MYVVPPEYRDKNSITDSNIPEGEEGITVFSGSHSLGDIVQKDGCVYRSEKDSNTSTPKNKLSTLEWTYLYQVNRYRCFDEYNSTITSYPDRIEYVVDSRYVDTVAFFKLKAQKVIVSVVTDETKTLENAEDGQILDADGNTIITGDNVLFHVEQKTVFRDVYNYTSYVTAQGDYQRTLVLSVFPHNAANLKITIVNEGATAEVGNIVYGRKYDLGLTLADPQPFLEHSNLFEIDRDEETGRIKSTPIVPLEDMTIPVLTETRQLERTNNKLLDLMGKACLWVALERTDRLPNLVVYGFYQRLETPISLNWTQRELIIKGVA